MTIGFVGRVSHGGIGRQEMAERKVGMGGRHSTSAAKGWSGQSGEV